MTLQQTIRRILREEFYYNECGHPEDLSESTFLDLAKLPPFVRRRVNFSSDYIMNILRKSILSGYVNNNTQETIANAVSEAADIILVNSNLSDSEYDSPQTHNLLKNYIRSNFMDEILKYYNSVFSNDDDEYYVFIKHKERHGGRGFSSTKRGWNNFLSEYGRWFTDLDWNEIKRKLDSLPQGQQLLLKRPLENHPYEYYFSIVKK